MRLEGGTGTGLGLGLAAITGRSTAVYAVAAQYLPGAQAARDNSQASWCQCCPFELDVPSY